ncbi:tetratricopeptide repeat protein [Ferruginibacter lapsinanis]|uniref:tetratricopeptide repeat protein n=1 Tax=Ferruginibacter lapsinanis TaxID=563172 RepID=UPI001E5B2F19|nr:tetratricopeptide repeat protein [Ferruginibacter lapsinanis]UEG49906.1 tetratricopeptide repeat protein [Ferruginibacter lapsinanis]
MKIKITKENVIKSLSTNKWWHMLALIVLPALIYFQTVKFDYTNFDDNGIILQKFDIVGDIKKIDTAYKVDAFFNKSGDFYRPVQNITFMLDAQVSREKLWMFHITNLLIHIFTGIALYFFLQVLKIDRLNAFLLSLLFAAHPLFASGVGWVPSRGDILIGLLGILLFITFDRHIVKRKFIYFILHALVFLVIIFTKETTILFPLLLLFHYFLNIQHPHEIKKIKYHSLKLLPYFIVWASVLVFYFMMRKNVVANSGATSDVLGIIPFFKNNTVIPTIIGKFFFPYNLSTFPLYNNTDTIIGSIFLLLVAFVTIYFSAKKHWVVLLGLLWFLFFAVPPTIYRLENADVFFNYLEHRTYLPMIGMFIIVGFAFNTGMHHVSFKKTVNWVYIPVLAVFTILAAIHCADYKDSFTLRNRAATLDNPSGLSGRAGEYLSKGDTTKALEDINRAIQLNNKDANMYFERGKIMARLQKHEEAEADFSLALGLQPNAVDALMARSIEKRLLKKYESAFRDIFQAASLDSTNPKVFNSFGNLFLEVKDYNQAIGSYSRAIKLQPNFPDPYNNRSYAKILNGDYQGAITDCYTALQLMKAKPSPIVYNNLGHAHRELNHLDSAFFYFDKAIALKNNFSQAYFERGIAKQKNNDITGACKDWRSAAAYGYTDTLKLTEKYCR